MSDPHATSFGRIAGHYARARPRYPAALFERLAALSAGRGVAVDVGAGSGQGATALLHHFDRVYAVEPDAALLATLPADPRLVPIQQDAHALDLPEPADLVAVFQALHWFAEDAFWDRVARTLKPGGLLAAVGYAWFTVDEVVDAVIAGAFLPALEPHWSPRNRLLFGGYRDVAVPFAELDPGSPLAITLSWTRPQLVDYLSTWSAVTTLREKGRDPLAEVGAALLAAWPDESPRTVTMPLSLRLFRA